MPKFRKKPVEIEARQWDGTATGASPVIDWILAAGGTASFYCDSDEQCRALEHSLSISTLEGRMFALPGDWIICGTRGEFYPCKPGPFEDTFEPLQD